MRINIQATIQDALRAVDDDHEFKKNRLIRRLLLIMLSWCCLSNYVNGAEIPPDIKVELFAKAVAKASSFRPGRGSFTAENIRIHNGIAHYIVVASKNTYNVTVKDNGSIDILQLTKNGETSHRKEKLGSVKTRWSVMNLPALDIKIRNFLRSIYHPQKIVKTALRQICMTKKAGIPSEIGL